MPGLPHRQPRPAPVTVTTDVRREGRRAARTNTIDRQETTMPKSAADQAREEIAENIQARAEHYNNGAVASFRYADTRFLVIAETTEATGNSTLFGTRVMDEPKLFVSGLPTVKQAVLETMNAEDFSIATDGR